MDLSFSGAGFMGCYYFGVVDCWNKYVPRDRVNRVAGASAGSLIAAYYLMDLPLKDCLKEIIGLTEDVRRRPLGVFDRSNQIVDVLPKILDRLFPDDAHKRVSGRLHVCMTRLKDMKKIIVNEFESKKDLIDALNCSCFIPVWSGNHVSTYKGVKHIDGGFTDNLPVFDEHTIRICCFSGATDISPYDRAKMEMLSGTVLNMPLYLNFANCRRFRKALFPPPASYIVDLLERGFHDAKDFILSNDLIQCDTCYNRTDLHDQPIYSKISPTLSPAITPSISPAGSYLNLATNKSNSETISKRQKQNKPNKIKDKLQVDINTSSSSVTNDLLKTRSATSQLSFNELLQEKLSNCSPDSANVSDSIVSRSANDLSPTGSEHRANEIVPPIKAPVIVIESADQDDQEESAELRADKSPTANNNNNINKQSSSSGLSSASRSSFAGSDELANKSGSISSSSSSNSNESSHKRTKPTAGGVGNMSASEKYLANRRSTIQDNSKSLLVLEDKFKLAPNPLPSCPPSPNLNRHCTECIKMRQEARMDLIEEEIRQEAEKYRQVQPAKEGGFTSKLINPIKWIRQLGIKSSYKFVPDDPLPSAQGQLNAPALAV